MFEIVRPTWNSRPERDPAKIERQRILEVERQRILAEVHERYRRELVGNLGPVDRSHAESIVRRMYEFAQLRPPEEFIWVDHPEDGVVASVLMARHQLAHPDVRNWSNLQPDMVAPRIRRWLIAGGGPLPNDESMMMLARWVPSLHDAADVFRNKLAARGLLALTKDVPFAIDSWLDAFLILEEEFALQSPRFTLLWKQAASGVWTLSEQEHREELKRLTTMGHRIIHEQMVWNWIEPFMFSGSIDAIYGALAELHYANLRSLSDSCIDINRDGIELMLEYLRHCGWCWPFSDFCIMADRPEELFALKDIDDTHNIEARRLMIELYGLGRYLKEKNARLLQKDEYGELYYMSQSGEEALTVVKVINSTPEPDGSFREYFIRVPPTTKTAREGIAWTFELAEHDYAAKLET